MAELFECSSDNISLHLKNIFKSGELDKDSVTEEYSATASGGKKNKTKFYSLEAIIAVGYRVNSSRGTQFRIWATEKLKNYILKGFAIDTDRFKKRVMGSALELGQNCPDTRADPTAPYVFKKGESNSPYERRIVMKKLFVVIAISLLFYSPVLFAETSIRITNGEWEPFMSEYSAHYGMNSHVVSEAFKLEGINVIWGFFPWKRAYINAKEGRYWDASATWWPVEETQEAFLISDSISTTSFVFFYLKTKKFDWQSIDDLKGLRIGGTLEYDYGKDFMTAMTANKIYVELVPKDEQNYKKLLADRIDIFPNDPIVGYAQIRNCLPPEQAELIRHHPKEFEKTTLNLIISKRSKNALFFLEKFNSGLKKLQKSGRFDQMLNDLEAGKYDKRKVKWKE